MASLGPEWLVLHAVPVGKGTSDIDHVLVGPGGVFTINTNNHSGQPVWVAGRTLMVGGKRTRHLHNAAHEAERAAKLLSHRVGFPVEVRAVVVIVDPKSLTLRARPQQVAELTQAQLLGWLRRRGSALSQHEVSRIASAAVQADTWRCRPTPTADPALLQRNFDALRVLVDQARRRRAAWALAVPAAGLVLLANSASWGAAILQRLP